jgi:hypothetical protein
MYVINFYSSQLRVIVAGPNYAFIISTSIENSFA